MGNCIKVLSSDQSEKKATVLTYDGDVLEFRGSTKVKRVVSGRFCGHNLVHRSRPYFPLTGKSKLVAGEVYYLVPDLEKVLARKVVREEKSDNDKSSSQKVKMVVTMEELELLLASAEKQYRISQEFFEQDSPKWRPSLSSIAEADEF